MPLNEQSPSIVTESLDDKFPLGHISDLRSKIKTANFLTPNVSPASIPSHRLLLSSPAGDRQKSPGCPPLRGRLARVLPSIPKNLGCRLFKHNTHWFIKLLFKTLFCCHDVASTEPFRSSRRWSSGQLCSKKAIAVTPFFPSAVVPLFFCAFLQHAGVIAGDRQLGMVPAMSKNRGNIEMPNNRVIEKI